MDNMSLLVLDIDVFIYLHICIYIYIYNCWKHRLHSRCYALLRYSFEKCNLYIQSFTNIIYLFYIEHHALLSIIGLFQIFQMIPVLSAIRAVCFWQCHLVVTAQQEVTSLSYWSPCQNAFTKWLPPWRKGRISCLWIKSVFGKCLHGIWF